MIVRAILAAAIATVIATGVIKPAAAAVKCHSRDAVLGHLAKNYHEQPTALGYSHNGGVVELFKAKDGKTWTIVITLPNGPTCLLAAGKDWEDIAKVMFGKQS